MNQPIAKIIGIHSDKTAMCAKPDKAWGLEPCLYLCVGAKVMLRINLLTKFGLVNGATGIIRDIVFAENAEPHDMPISIIHIVGPANGYQLVRFILIVPQTSLSAWCS